MIRDGGGAVGGGAVGPLACDEVRAIAAELALGIVGGPARSAALSHLDECIACRNAVDELAPAADTLLLMAGEADPPVGFEVDLLGRVRREAAPPPAASPPMRLKVAALLRSPKGRLTGAVAAAVLAAAGSGVAIGEAVAPGVPSAVGSTGRTGITAVTVPGAYGGTYLEVKALESASHTSAGQVLLTGTRPEWLLMSVSGLHVSAWVNCVVRVSGRDVNVGTFQLVDGKGTWSVRLPRAWVTGDVTDARIVGPDGSVLASASL